MLDFSQRPELSLYASVVADVEAAAAPLRIATLIAGAFARDLHLLYRHGIDVQRQTEDLDLAFALPDWAAFAALKEQLTSSGAFQPAANAAHRLRHRNGLPVDIVPFGNLETSARTIVWPPRGEVVMDVFGFREAFVAAHEVLLPGSVRTKLVSLPALALLKIVCWQDRHYAFPLKDAHDLHLILQNYLRAGNEQRLWDEFGQWTEEETFQYEFAGARMLGFDLGALLDDGGIDRVAGVLSEQVDEDKPGVLAGEMNAYEPNRARALLKAMLSGMLEKRHK
ncbi:MAG TPA: nucleotidyl transferase AbiEii/AbiGii toxin family protein [Candidatus Binataceae bacterium]|nr:nucleotidyl transferase AbiEii/AbiGii toxin family protein [Candidatus Binataceae bacterium]